VVPIVVGVSLLLATYFLPKLFEKGKRISYSVDGPTAYVDPEAASAAKITVGGVETPNIYGYKVRIWNSGGYPLTALAVRFVFDTKDQNFKVFSVTHDTIPKIEFGSIEESGSELFSKRFTYQLLNPKDEDALTFLTNISAGLSVFVKSEGLRTQFVPSKPPSSYLSFALGVLAAVLGIIALLQLVYLQKRLDRFIKR
jgi:hypothetical protein